MNVLRVKTNKIVEYFSKLPALLYFVNITNMLIVGRKDDNYSRVFLFLLIIVLYKAFSVVRIYEYNI